MKPIFRFSFLATLLLALCFSADAQVSAPQFLPGQPMVVGEQVLMMWGPVPGATRYAIFHNGREVTRVGSNQYLGVLPSEPGEHRYQIAAVTAQGAVGALSNPGTVRVRRIGTPTGVIVRANAATESIDVLWDRVEGAIIYNVYRTTKGADRQLVASVQEETFKDAQVTGGTEYTYEITAKDLSGQEGPPSQVAGTTMTGSSRRPTDKVVFRALPTTETLSIPTVANQRLSQVTYLGGDPDGNMWLVTPDHSTIHSFDAAGELRFTWGPYRFEDTGYLLVPQKLAHGPDGNTYVSDAVNGVLACIDPDGVLLWARGVPTPPPSELELWKDFPTRLQSQLSTPSSVLCRKDELWVTDQRFQLVYRMDYQARVLGHLTHYQLEAERLRLPGIGELLPLSGETTLFTFPLSHRAVTLDAASQQVAAFGDEVRGYVGGFVGIHGATAWDEGSVLLTDPAVASLQVFDVATGRYRFHISGPDPRPDPAYSQRADLPLRKPNLAVRAAGGTLWVYDAADHRISVRRISGEVTPPLDGG